MEKTSVQYIKEAAKKLMNSKLQRLGAAKTQEIFNGVMRTVGLETVEEVYLFVAHFDLTCRENASNMDDLSRYFECSTLDMLDFIPALKSLERKGFIVRRRRRCENILKQNFAVSDAVMAAIIENQQVKIGNVKVEDVHVDRYEFCKRVGSQVKDDDVVTEDLLLFVEKLENDNAHLEFVSALKQMVSEVIDRTLFYEICSARIDEDDDVDSYIGAMVNNIYSNFGQGIRAKRSIVDGEHILIRLGLIEISCDDEDSVRLTDKGKELFLGEDITAFEKSYKCQDIYGFLTKVDNYFHSTRNYDSNSSYGAYTLNRDIEKFECANTHIPEIGKLKAMMPDNYERVMFYCIGQSMIDDSDSALSYEVNTIYPRQERKRIMNDFRDKRHHLQKMNLVEIEKSSSLFGDKTHVVMTDKGKEVLLGEDASLYINDFADHQLIDSDQISEKRLFFSSELDGQLSLVRSSLDEENYKGLCARLEEKHLPKGIAVLLYGEPGTGKTESVMQIAKATGRAVMHVDISTTKTCWFGESEKLIKKVFTDYRRMCDKSTRKPILLFNEADAVFSRRKDSNSSSVAQTENAIQNIILEEMENLDGILIATTNLVDNLDGAFERRFLFKIRFDKTTTETRRHIWMNKMPLLTDDDALTLANTFEFSGGQIDNIVRKALMEEVVKGYKPTLNRLVELCGEEKISKNGVSKIGFC